MNRLHTERTPGEILRYHQPSQRPASALLQDSKRITYRALKREFDLDEEALEDLREELIAARRVAMDEDDKILVWVGPDKSPPVAPSSPSLAPASSTERRLPDADRRQLTVMFCDLVGSTPMSAQLDPEDYRDIMQAYQEMCGQVLARFTGHIARYEGDGILVYFGYPQAQEDAVAQAVRAGLQIIEGLPGLNACFQPRFPLLQERPLQVRTLIHRLIFSLATASLRQSERSQYREEQCRKQ